MYGGGYGRSLVLLVDLIEKFVSLLDRFRPNEMPLSAGNCSLPKAWCHWRFPSGEAQWSVSNQSSTAATISTIRKSYSQASDRSGKIIAFTMTCGRQLFIPLRVSWPFMIIVIAEIKYRILRNFWCHGTSLKGVILCSKEG